MASPGGYHSPQASHRFPQAPLGYYSVTRPSNACYFRPHCPA